MNRELKEIIKSRANREIGEVRCKSHYDDEVKQLTKSQEDAIDAYLKAKKLSDDLYEKLSDNISFNSNWRNKARGERAVVIKRKTDKEIREFREKKEKEILKIEKKYEKLMLELSLEKDKDKIFKALKDAGITF